MLTPGPRSSISVYPDILGADVHFDIVVEYR